MECYGINIQFHTFYLAIIWRIFGQFVKGCPLIYGLLRKKYTWKFAK